MLIVRLQPQLKKKGLLLFNSSLVNGVAFPDKIVSLSIPATNIADAVGEVKAVNLVMLCDLIAKTDVLKKSSFDILFSFPDRPSGDNKAADINKKFNFGRN